MCIPYAFNIVKKVAVTGCDIKKDILGQNPRVAVDSETFHAGSFPTFGHVLGGKHFKGEII